MNSETTHGSPHVILIAEDSPTQREMLRYMLENNAFTVESATNGRNALILLERIRPVAVITDIDMPEMDGYALCRSIKGDSELKGIPVILLTSLSDPENVIMGLACGADYFIMKPYSEEFLLSRIEHILANRTLESNQRELSGQEISFRGKHYCINSERQQILNLLLSTYETAIEKNQELADASAKLTSLNEQLEDNMAELESKNRQLLTLNVEFEKQRRVAYEAKLQAEEANRAKSDFLSSMSHELRSPLNAILGFAQLMETDIPPPTPVQNESIAQILQAGWHLLKLINEILDLAKIESRQTPLTMESVSLADVMLECQGMIEPQAQQRGIPVTFPCFTAPVFVMGDQTRVKQVLINLLSNAIKYNCTLGTVEVQCRKNPHDRIRVSVKDSGAGLSMNQLEQLFQPFNRLGQENGSEEGTGIGLMVSKQLVELMGGVIGVESGVGIGSVFWFELMAANETNHVKTEGTGMAVKQHPVPSGTILHTLLYVEDNQANISLVEHLIARHPTIRLLIALDGASGIELARSSLPDVILMDINLPGISGIDALKILRSDSATAHIPVIAVSANAMLHDIQRGLDEGFYRYITKPISVNEFMIALNEALDLCGKVV
jgi:signal transduction histidine kinase